MLYKLRNTAARRLHDLLCRGIMETAPLKINPSGLTFCSLVSQRDIIMYLVAIKSIYTKIREGVICVINDGSITQDGLRALRYHLGEPSIIHIRDISTDKCPRGGCWERLLHILSLTESAYVIQIDSDVLVRNSIPEIVQCYRENRSFTLGTWMGQRIVSLTEASAVAKASGGTHIQMVAEQAFDRVDKAAEKRYVRGCAGFAGFARGQSARRVAEEFSEAMQAMVGERWREWGSEQVTSNYVIANSENPYVLPLPVYSNFSPNVSVNEASLLHFLGSHRFYRGVYTRESRRLIARLR